MFSSQVCGTLFYHSRTTHANAWCCPFNTKNFWVITAWFAAVRLRPVPPTLGVVTNTEGFGESWNLSCISALAKCKSVRKPHTNLPDTPADLTGALKWFQMFPGPPWTKQSVLSHARAFSGALESTGSYGGAFRMLQDLTYTIVKLWSCRDLCAGLQET